MKKRSILTQHRRSSANLNHFLQQDAKIQFLKMMHKFEKVKAAG
jgi:hypothetical protein